MKRRIFLILILALALFLRYYKIGQFPATLYGDEQAFAWNAWNILKTGRDEYGTFMPLQFRSFNDYKAPLPVYLLVPFFKIFGMNPWSIRVPISIASFLTVFVFYFFCRRFLASKLTLLSVFFFAISPWHIHLSRGFFEATLALLFFFIGIYFFTGKKGTKQLIFSAVFFALSVYSYFTPRLLLPFFIPFLLLYWYKITKIKSSKSFLKSSSLFLIVLLILVLPQVYLTFFGHGLSRFNKLNETVSTVITKSVNAERNASNLPLSWRPIFHNKLTVWLRLFKNNYLEHFSLNFWFLYGDNSLRYFLGNMGLFYLIEMPALLLGFVFLFRKYRPLALFLAGWLILAPLPASIVGRSFAVRSLSMLPAPFIFIAAGVFWAGKFFSKAKIRLMFFVLLSLLVSYSLGFVLIKYYLEYPVYAATWWGWENKAAIDYAKARQGNFDHIFISDFYTGSTLAFAVYNQYDPIKYRQALQNPVTMADNRHLIKLGKYYFGSLDLDQKRLSQNIIPPKSLYIGRPEEADSDVTVNAPDDGRIIFKIYQTR